MLPCFWVYAHMGKVLIERAGEMDENHPYRTWVQTYDAPEFDESTRKAVEILERELDRAPADEAARMRAAFERACVYELHFWASAHALQDWDAGVFAVPAADTARRAASAQMATPPLRRRSDLRRGGPVTSTKRGPRGGRRRSWSAGRTVREPSSPGTVSSRG